MLKFDEIVPGNYVVLVYRCIQSNYLNRFSEKCFIIHFELVSFYFGASCCAVVGFLKFLGGIERDQWHQITSTEKLEKD